MSCLREYSQKIHRLEQSFAGVKNPHDMGTTGLIGWVCVSSGKDLYTRFRTARKIIRERGLNVTGFVASCIKSCPCEWRRERIVRYAGK
jgi:hypothetical protein